MQVTEGKVYMSLDDKDVEVFYRVDKVWQDAQGATWLGLTGMKDSSTVRHIPALFLEETFYPVSERTVEILFGRKK